MKKYILGTLAAAAMLLAGCSQGTDFEDAVFLSLIHI